VEYLLIHHADYNLSRSDGKKAIHIAAGLGYTDIVEIIINFDKDQLNCLSDHLTTPFYEAAANNQLELMKKLVELGKPDVHYINPNSGANAMHFAAINSNVDMINFLLNHKVNLNVMDNRGLTPLQQAVSSKVPSIEVIKTLLKNGAEVNDGDTPPLYLLASFTIGEGEPEAQEAAKLLLGHGAQIDPEVYGEAFFDSYA
jgi:ankyrin repeat protein